MNLIIIVLIKYLSKFILERTIDMALIKEIKRINKLRGSVHKPVECTYFTFNNYKGEKYLILDTYGSEDRQIKNKVSQTIQFNKESAKELFKIIKEEFNIT